MVSLTPANSTRNNDNKILGVSDLCRICMLPGDYFKNSSHDITIRICKMLKTSTQIDVGINDGYSQIMCNNCYKQLYESYKFVLLAKSTQKELRKNPPLNEIKKEIPPVINSSKNETQKENTLSPIKENIDSNLNSNTKIDIAKIKSSNISEKIPIKENQSQNKRLALRSSIKKEDIIIIENNNSIDLTSSPVEENLPSNLIENEKKPDFIEPKPLDPVPAEKKPRRTERKFSKTKEIEVPEAPIEIDVKEEQKSPIDKKLDVIEIVEVKENSNSNSEEILNPFSITETKTNSEILPIRQRKKKSLAKRFSRKGKKGSRVVKTPIVKVKRRKKNIDQKLILAAQKTISSVKSENEIEIFATTSTREVLLEKTTENLVANNKKSGEFPSQKINVKFASSEEKTGESPLLKVNKRTAAYLEFKRRFSDRVASKLKENEIKIDLTLSEDPEVVPIKIDESSEMISKDLKDEVSEIKIPEISEELQEKSLRERSPEKNQKGHFLDKTSREKSPEKHLKGNSSENILRETSPESKEKLVENSPKEKLTEKILRARSPDKSAKDKPSERHLRVRSLENPSKGNTSGKTVRDKSPEKSLKGNLSEKTLRDKSPEKSPKEMSSGKILRERSPEKSPKEMSSGKMLRERSPDKSPKESKEKIPRRSRKASKEKLSNLNPILIDDDTIIKKVENDPAVLKFLKQSSKNEKVLKEHTYQNLNQTQDQTQTSSAKKLSPTKILIVKNKRRSKKDIQDKSKLVQTSIASYYMSPPDKQIKQEMLSPKIESLDTITRSQLEIQIQNQTPIGESQNQKVNEKLASNETKTGESPLQKTNAKLSPKDKKSGESPLQKTNVKLSPNDKKPGETPLQKTNVKLASNDKKSGEPPKVQKIDSKLSSNEITLFTQSQSQSQSQNRKNRTPQKHISIMSPKMLKSRKSAASSVPNQNFPVRSKVNQNGIPDNSEPNQNFPVRSKLNQNGVSASSESNQNGFPASSEPNQNQNLTFLGDISLLPQSAQLNGNPNTKMNPNEPYVLLETLDSNILKRKRIDSISPLQLKKQKELQQPRSLNSKKLISKLKSKKITVVSHKKNSDGKLRKKVKKTFIKINTKYLTRTIKTDKDKDKDKDKEKEKIGKGKRKISNSATELNSKTKTLRETNSKTNIDSKPIKTEPSLDDILSAVGLVRKGSEGVPSKHECKICNLKFCWTESYRRHLASKHKLMPYQCRICNDKFASAIKLRKHKKEVHDANNKPYKCIQCGENFDTFETHLLHVQETHNNKPKINCKLCKAEGFDSEEKLQEHLDWHEKVKRETEIIEQKVKASLPVIVRANNRNFQCEHCSKQFRKSSDLVRHNRVHTGEKPFPCSLCNQKFQQRPNLQKHIISVHSERKSFSCDICFKTFGRYDSKLRHMLTHSIEKPFSCNECKIGFVRECQLATHFKRIHSKNKKIKLEEPIVAEKAVAEI